MNKWQSNEEYYGNSELTTIFKKLIWDNENKSNSIMINNNILFFNVLFRNIGESNENGWLQGNLSSFYKFTNCIVLNYVKNFLNENMIKNTTISGCYGYFTYQNHSDKEINRHINKIITNNEITLKINDKYIILDNEVDTTKIGLYAIGENTWANPLCLIKMNNKYYSISEEFYNQENKNFNDIGQLDFNKSFDINLLTKQNTYGNDTFIPLEKFDNFNIIFEDENISKVIINGHKSENEIVEYILDIRMVDTFNSITINGENTLFLLKFEDNEGYYSYDFEKNEMIESSLSNIETEGVDIQQTSLIDFNKIKEQKNNKNISFVFLLNKESIINSMTVDYMEIGTFSQKDSSETNLKVGFKKITIQPTFDASVVKINIL